jgi:hypothetical protein
MLRASLATGRKPTANVRFSPFMNVVGETQLNDLTDTISAVTHAGLKFGRALGPRLQPSA